MIQRLSTLVAAWLLSFVVAASVSAAPPQRIIAVGDLHGDFAAWQTIARAAGLMDTGGHWTGGTTTLVQMGDITDREPDSLKIIRSLQQLEREASRSGGKVYVILGNHEAMNLLGDNRYTTPGEYQAFVDNQSEARRAHVFEVNHARLETFYRTQNPGITPEQVRALWMAAHPLGWVEHKLAWAPSGELGRWATNNPAIAKIAGTLFVHGGISAEYAAQSLIDINAHVKKAMAAGDDSDTSILVDPLGPLWYRGLAGTDPEAATVRATMKPPHPPQSPDAELGTVLAAYDAKRIVIAHTPSLSGITISSDGRLARIDTGISRFYGGPLSWLEITGTVMTPHTVARAP